MSPLPQSPSPYQNSSSILGERGLVIVNKSQCPSSGQVAAGFLLLMAFAVFRMPPWLPLFAIESNGVDPSWQMLLNEAVSSDWVFGRDLFFTYGPFGFIHARMYHPETWGILVTAWLGISVIMADLVWRVSGPGRLSFVGRALFGFAILEFMSRDAMAVCFGLHALVFMEAVGISRKDAKTQRADSIVGPLHVVRQAIPILLLAALPWAKFSYFVTAAFFGCALLVAGFVQRRFPWQALLSFTVCPLAWLMSGATLAECGQFIGTGFQLAGGYSAAMGLGPDSTAGAVAVIAAAFVVLTLPVWLVSRLRLGDWRLSILTMLFFHGLLFITWKSCFVRYHAERIPVFLGTVFPLMAYGWLTSRLAVGNPTRERGTSERFKSLADASGYHLNLAANRWKHWQSQWHTFLTTLRTVERRFGLPILLSGLVILLSAGTLERVQSLTFGEVIGQATAPIRDQLLTVAESVRNPNWRQNTHEEQLAKIRAANPIPDVDGSVDVFPSKLIVGVAHGLDLRPRPVLQSYAAFTPALIDRDALHFRGDNAPDHVLISIGEIDNRLPTMEDSRAWFELLANYELTDSSDDLLTLSRRERPVLALSPEPEIRTTVRFGELVNVPPAMASPVWCRIQINPSLAGRAASILYRLPELRLQLQSNDGVDREFRLLPGAASAGFLVSPVVETREDLIRLWERRDDFDLENAWSENRAVGLVCSVSNDHWMEMLFEADVTVEFFECIRRVDPVPESVRPPDVATRARSSY